MEHFSYIHYLSLFTYKHIFFSNMSASALRILLINVSVLYTKEQTLLPIFSYNFVSLIVQTSFFDSLNIKRYLIP